MKGKIYIFLFFMALLLLPAVEAFAQSSLTFEGKIVKSMTFEGYYATKLHVRYIDSTDNFIKTHRHTYTADSRIYQDALKEIQLMLNEISHNLQPSAEDLDIDSVSLKKAFSKYQVMFKHRRLFVWPDKEDYVMIRDRFVPLDSLNGLLQRKHPVVDSEAVVVSYYDSNCKNPDGLKITIQTDEKSYFFDMLYIECFQPMLMRTSSGDCLKDITNFRVNKHLHNIFQLLKIRRSVPYQDEIIQEYLRACGEKWKESRS